MRIGVVALPTTRAISYHEDRSNSRNRFFWIFLIFLIFLIFWVFMAVPPPLEKNHSTWQGWLQLTTETID